MVDRAYRLTEDVELIACLECGGLWTRAVQRGAKPKRCPSCRRLECEMCGGGFQAPTANRGRRFCSRDCAGRWFSESGLHGQRDHGACRAVGCEDGAGESGWCRRHYQRVYTHGHWRIGTYQCKDCGDEFQADIEDGRAMSKSRCYWCLTHECERCGRRSPREHLSHPTKDRFCSRDCYNAWRTEHARPLSICNRCGTQYRPKRSDRTGQYCSRECALPKETRPAPRGLSPVVESGPALPVVFSQCDACGVWETNQDTGQARARFCSEHRYLNTHDRRRFNCARCGRRVVTDWLGDSRRRFCSDECCQNYHSVEYDRRKRAILRGVEREPYDSEAIYQRDDWTCGICGERIDRRCKSPHPRSASIDHIIPLSEGGADVKANVQCAHRKCNRAKSSGSAGSQLLLVG